MDSDARGDALTSLGALALSKLPPSMLEPEVLGLLSADGQVYAQCTRCEREHLVDMFGKTEKSAIIEAVGQATCARCEQRSLQLVRHALKVAFVCSDCNAESEVDVGADALVECPKCQSDRLSPVREEMVPPYPGEFDDLEAPAWQIFAAERHTWGVSGTADAELILRMNQMLSTLPAAHRYTYLAILFARRLRITSSYDVEGEYTIVNAAANLEQGYLRATGDPVIGVQALFDFAEMVELAPNELTMALAEHSFAMGAFSLLSRWNHEYVDAITGEEDLRGKAIGTAAHASDILEKHIEEGVEGLESQLARVQYIVGDLLRVGDTDDEARAAALEFFTAAESDPWVAQHMGFAIAQSRAHTIAEMADPPEELLVQAASDLREAAAATGSDTAYENRWLSAFQLARLLMRYGGERHSGLAEIEAACAGALQQFSAFGDEMQTVYQLERISEPFELLAFRYADFGWNDEALSALEAVRGVAVRRYSMTSEQIDAELAEVSARNREDLLPAAVKDAGLGGWSQVSERSIEDYFESDPIGPPTQTLMRGHDEVATAVVYLWVSELWRDDPIVSALVCHMVEKDAWSNQRHMWRPQAGALESLRQSRWIEPGPFRERLLRSACRTGWQTLLEPIWSLVEETGASRLALILPGRMTRLPVEAFLDGSGAVAMDGRSATYLPSVRFGADLVGRSTRTGGYPGDEQRVLAIGYGGDDMPEHRAELDDLAGIWGKRLHIVAGDKCTKASVIEVLRQPWDIVHVAAHGTFDEVTPLRSALHFRADRDDDAHRVTAEDLLRDIQRPGHPLVILSACSSVVTADSKSNSFHGLAGSLFRIGAQAIIGSRWPVGDLAARRCMTELHRGLAEGMDADLALSRAGTRMRDDGLPAEEWAAFGYFGVA